MFLFFHAFTEQRLVELLPCRCLGMPRDINTNKALKDYWSLRLLTRPCMIGPLFLCSSPANPVCCFPPPTAAIPDSSHQNMFLFLGFSKSDLFCLSLTLLTRPFLDLYLSFVQLKSQFVLLESHPWFFFYLRIRIVFSPSRTMLSNYLFHTGFKLLEGRDCAYVVYQNYPVSLVYLQNIWPSKYICRINKQEERVITRCI